LIHTEANSTSYFLEPVGTSDPREFIEAESKRIPFKAALSGPPLWQDAFKNWPLPPIAGWRNWYKRILADNNAKTSNWDSLHIAQCLELSLAETPKNENLLIAACHFWSNGVIWTSLGPLPRWVPGPTTRWAPGTTRLALHGT
jgi:hypothetical protein